MLINTSPRFQKMENSSLPSKKADLLLFVSITSSGHHSHLRHAIRSTWILPCKASSVCDYRFFVDTPRSMVTNALISENMTYHDMVFRDSCPLMNRHPAEVNYGNSPPVLENILPNNFNFHKRSEGDGSDVEEEQSVSGSNITVPNYALRRAYKIDWKVCFLRWTQEHRKMAHYHAFVEDDSYMCVENLLYQCALLKEHSSPSAKPFRTGTAMFDGFDDSSTFMSKEVAVAFANHYWEPGFNCSNVFGEEQPGYQEINNLMEGENPWLSWGNSWIHKNCNWQQALKDALNVTIYQPNMKCMVAEDRSSSSADTRESVATTAEAIKYFPCSDRPLIFHHREAGDILLRDEEKSQIRTNHMCEYMLMIDKVKSVTTMFDLWNKALAHHYHDFSPVFTQDGFDGWRDVMKVFQEDEETCRRWWLRNNQGANRSQWDDGSKCMYTQGRRVLRPIEPTANELELIGGVENAVKTANVHVSIAVTSLYRLFFN